MELRKIALASEIGTFVLTVVLVGLAVWPLINPPSTNSASQAATGQGAPLTEQPSNARWRNQMTAWGGPAILTIALLLAGWLHVKAVRQEHGPDSQQHGTESLKAIPPGPDQVAELRAGSRVRIANHSALSELEKTQSPQWIPEMDQYSGREHVVSSISPDGWLTLEDVPYTFRREWITRLPD